MRSNVHVHVALIPEIHPSLLSMIFTPLPILENPGSTSAVNE